MKRGRLPFTVLLLAVTLPLLVLAVLAWAGVASMRQSAWVAARNTADSVAAGMGSGLALNLAAKSRPIPMFDDPPLPGPAAESGDPLEGNDLGDLEKLARHKVNGKLAPAGLSPAGLPRRLLAALRLLEADGSEYWAEWGLMMAEQEPSSLSTRALEEVVRRFPEKQEHLRLWRQSLDARKLALAHPDLLQRGGLKGGYWIGMHDGSPKFLSTDQAHQWMVPLGGLPWASIRVNAGGHPLAGPSGGRVLATAPVAFGNGLTVEVVVTDSALVESGTRQIQRWVSAVLLDVMMPGLDGYAVCRELRKRGREMPVLMLTAKGQIDDRVDGLDSGADDYLVKPFSLKELLARVRALLRRRERESAVPEVLEIGASMVDFRKGILIRGGMKHPLSEKETGILRLLAAHAGENVSRERFLDVVWGYNAFPSTRTVDNFIATLRTKLEPDPANPVHLVTVRGTGYRLEQDMPPGGRSHQG